VYRSIIGEQCNIITLIAAEIPNDKGLDRKRKGAPVDDRI
jgi:hypothetical protein